MDNLDRLQAACAAVTASGDVDKIEAAGAALDAWEAEHPPPVFGLLPAALWYASQGLAVFPLQHGGKTPHPGSRGFHDATTDAATITGWWRQHPESNIGLVTGQLVDVIDIDGSTGVASYARELLDDIGAWLGPPMLGKVNTPRPGGHHIYITATPGRRNRRLLPGVETRGAGGYVVVPPSYSTQHGRHYEWSTPLQIGDKHDQPTPP